MALDLQQYLGVAVEDIKDAQPLPVGHYFADIVKWTGKTAKFQGAGGPETPVVQLDFKLTGADSDVDPELLPDGGGAGRLVNRSYELNDPDQNGIRALRKVGENVCGLDVKGLTLNDLLDQLKGQPVKLYIEQNTRGDDIFPKVTRVLSAEG